MFRTIRMWFDPRTEERAGPAPDYRFSLANERTFLAWIRTGLALVGGGLAVAQLIPPLAITHLRELISLALMALGGICAVRAVDRWVRVDQAIRRGEDLPRAYFPAILALAVGLGAALLCAAVLLRIGRP